jgi:uncharacterized protein
VNYYHNPFRINVGFFINQPVGYSREFPFEFDHIILKPDFELNNLTGNITMDRAQQGLRVRGKFMGSTPITCGRCLEQFDQKLEATFEDIFTFPYYPLSENEYLIPEDGFIDLEPLISDYLALEIPINPVCASDCKGLCIMCGQNLNLGMCDHQPGADNESNDVAEFNRNLMAEDKK